MGVKLGMLTMLGTVALAWSVVDGPLADTEFARALRTGAGPAEAAPRDMADDATARARAELPTVFTHAFDRSGQAIPGLMFKVSYDCPAPGAPDEAIWLSSPALVKDGFVGLLANAPACPGVQLGDVAGFTQAQILDWGLDTGDTVYGAHTMRGAAIRDARLSADPLPADWR